MDDPDHLQKKIVRNLTNLYAFRRLDDPDNNKKVCYKISRPLCIWPGHLDDPDHLQKVFRNLTVLFAFNRLIWMIQIIYKKVVENLIVLFAFGRLIWMVKISTKKLS